ncbi:Uncharacterised protein [Streptococcus pneumoniae]|nr:Uncharacterised protein [Streptococcus pneumoniae]
MFETLRKSLQIASTLPCRTYMLLTSSVLSATSSVLSNLRLTFDFHEYETKSQTLSPFIILQEDIVFNYSFSLTSYSLFLYPNVEKTALGTVFH